MNANQKTDENINESRDVLNKEDFSSESGSTDQSNVSARCHTKIVYDLDTTVCGSEDGEILADDVSEVYTNESEGSFNFEEKKSTSRKHTLIVYDYEPDNSDDFETTEFNFDDGESSEHANPESENNFSNCKSIEGLNIFITSKSTIDGNKDTTHIEFKKVFLTPESNSSTCEAKFNPNHDCIQVDTIDQSEGKKARVPPTPSTKSSQFDADSAEIKGTQHKTPKDSNKQSPCKTQKRIMSTVNPGKTFKYKSKFARNVQKKVMRKIEAPVKKENPLTNLSSRLPFSAFKKIIVFGSHQFKQQLEMLFKSNLVQLLIVKDLTYFKLKQLIQDNNYHDTLWVSFLDIYDYFYICDLTSSSQKLRKMCPFNLSMNEHYLMNAANYLIEVFRYQMTSVNSLIPDDSKFVLLPPFPIELIDVDSIAKARLPSIHKSHPLSICVTRETHKTTGSFCSLLRSKLKEVSGGYKFYDLYFENFAFFSQAEKASRNGCLCQHWERDFEGFILLFLKNEDVNSQLSSYLRDPSSDLAKTGLDVEDHAALTSLSGLVSSVVDLHGGPYKKLFLLGLPHLLNLFTVLPSNVEKKLFSFENLEQARMDPTIFNRWWGHFDSSSSAIFLLLDASLVTKQALSLSSRRCSNDCHLNTMSSILTMREGLSDFCLWNLENFVRNLSTFIPIYILPLYPSFVIFQSPRVPVYHDLAHGGAGFFITYEAKDCWQYSFDKLSMQWNALLRANHLNAATSAISCRLIESNRRLFFEASESSFVSFLSEVAVWKTFVTAFLSASTGNRWLCISTVKRLSLRQTPDSIPCSPINSKQPLQSQPPTEVPTGIWPPMTHNQLPRHSTWSDGKQREIVVGAVSGSQFLPVDLFKQFATSIDKNATLEMRSGKRYFKLHSESAALHFVTQLQDLRAADLSLKTWVLGALSTIPYGYQISLPKFSDCYLLFRNEIIANIAYHFRKVVDVSSFKVALCKERCGSAYCPKYHSLATRRRSPFEVAYKPRMCPSVEDGQANCPQGMTCTFCHTDNEFSFHPLVYQSRLCPDDIGKCSQMPLCHFAHKDTPEVLFTDEWQDKIVFGLLSSFCYLDGAIRGKCKSDSLEEKKILFLSPDQEVISLVEHSLSSLARRFRMRMSSLISSSDPSDSFALGKVVLSTPSALLDIGFQVCANKYACIIVDDVCSLLADSRQRQSLIKFFDTLRIYGNLESPCKVIVADQDDKRSWTQNISNMLNICLSDDQGKHWTPDLAASSRSFLSPRQPFSSLAFSRQKQARVRSPLPSGEDAPSKRLRTQFNLCQ